MSSKDSFPTSAGCEAISESADTKGATEPSVRGGIGMMKNFLSLLSVNS